MCTTASLHQKGLQYWLLACHQSYWWLSKQQSLVITKQSLRQPRARLAPSQWETLLQSNTTSHWLGANLESALQPINPPSLSASVSPIPMLSQCFVTINQSTIPAPTECLSVTDLSASYPSTNSPFQHQSLFHLDLIGFCPCLIAIRAGALTHLTNNFSTTIQIQ